MFLGMFLLHVFSCCHQLPLSLDVLVPFLQRYPIFVMPPILAGAIQGDRQRVTAIERLKFFRFVALCRTFSPFFLKQESMLLNKQQNKQKNCSHVAARIESLDKKIGITKNHGLFHLNKCYLPTKTNILISLVPTANHRDACRRRH